jgi:N-acetylglucosaminyl-diphospho-decaprenol L-rhamnosyltransferase
MNVAVAIVSYRSATDIVACLAALARTTHARFEVIVCENGGPEAYEDLQAALPSELPGGQAVRAVLADRNLGFAGGVNRCLRETPGADAWWVLNPDTEPQPGALAAMVERLEVGDCDAVGCILALSDGTVQSYGGKWRKQLARAVSIGHGTPAGTPVEGSAVEAVQNYLNGASMLVGSRFFRAVGPMREDYFLYCEEVEWCLRARAAGLKLGFSPAAVVLHHQGTSTGNAVGLRDRSALSVYLGERNKILLTNDCFRGWLPVASVAALLLLILRFGRGRAWPQLAFAWRGWQAGLRGERGAPAHLVASRPAGAS